MAETVTIVSRPRSTKPATVSASALARQTYIGKLEAEGVIQRQGDGFPLDQSRVAYLRYLRRERRQSPHGEAEAAHAKAKTEMLQLPATPGTSACSAFRDRPNHPQPSATPQCWIPLS